MTSEFDIEEEVDRRLRSALEDEGGDPNSDSDHAMYLRQDIHNEVLNELRAAKLKLHLDGGCNKVAGCSFGNPDCPVAGPPLKAEDPVGDALGLAKERVSAVLEVNERGTRTATLAKADLDVINAAIEAREQDEWGARFRTVRALMSEVELATGDPTLESWSGYQHFITVTFDSSSMTWGRFNFALYNKAENGEVEFKDLDEAIARLRDIVKQAKRGRPA